MKSEEAPNKESGEKKVPYKTPWSSDRKKVISKVKRAMPKRKLVGRPSRSRASDSPWPKERGYPTSFVFDAQQYLQICEIANDERLTKKEMVFRLLREGLKHYYSGVMDMTFYD